MTAKLIPPDLCNHCRTPMSDSSLPLCPDCALARAFGNDEDAE